MALTDGRGSRVREALFVGLFSTLIGSESKVHPEPGTKKSWAIKTWMRAGNIWTDVMISELTYLRQLGSLTEEQYRVIYVSEQEFLVVDANSDLEPILHISNLPTSL